MVNLNQSSTATASSSSSSSSNQAGAAPPGPQNHNDNNDGARIIQNGHCGPRMPEQLSLDLREDIIFRYMNVTRMRREYAVRCLEENGFNLARALDIFDQLKEADALPDDLFIS